jgi:F-type H+-transporting ATPase subunit delta
MAEQPEKGSDVAEVYGAALFALAAEARATDAVEAELAGLVRLAEQDPSLVAFLTSAAIDADTRGHSLERMFRGRLSDLVLDTLLVMNRHGRAGLLHALWRAYVLRLEDARGQVEVVATGAVELGAAQKAEVEKVATELSGRKPLVKYVVDAQVIGGLVLQIGDWRYDNSVRRHLRDAQQRLLERSTRGAVSLRATQTM